MRIDFIEKCLCSRDYMSKIKIAFICPTYFLHFEFAKSLLLSFKQKGFEEQSHLWFVFGNAAEADSFGDYEYKLILPENYQTVNFDGIINIKKIWAIKSLEPLYDYIMTLDSESLFIRNVDLLQLCSNFFESKILLGNKILPEGKLLTDKIKDECKVFFSSGMQQKLQSELYLWFNQPCIYKTSNLNKFFEITKLHNNLNLINWFQFDYYIYMYYLILYEGFLIVDMGVESSYGVCEATDALTNMNSAKYDKFNIMLCTRTNFKLFDNPSLFLLIQLDRRKS